MATTIFFLISLFFSLQIHARESNFFSKLTTNNNANVKETDNQEPEKDPNFIPQTQNSYGLYGHKDLPSTTPTTKAAEEDTFKFPNTNSDTYYYNTNAYEMEEQSMHHNNTYESGQQNMDHNNDDRYYETRLSNENNYKDENNNEDDKYYKKNAYEAQQVRDRSYSKMYKQKKGMSDTRRFVENGKYHSENNPGGEEALNNGYNRRGYYGGNSFEGYQNQEEFQVNQDEFNP